MANSTVNVKNIAVGTTDNEIKDFFSFCGKISDIKVYNEGGNKSADVTFEKETAMKTALLLNNTQLGPNHITVSSPSGSDDDGSHFAKSNDQRESDEITQEEKPRTRILAEYLAHGYVVGDASIQKAIELDSTHGVSSRFQQTLQNLDAKYHASDRAKATDQSYGITQRATTFLSGLSSYFEKATSTPTGKKLVKFYEDGSRQVQEVHAEARRLADLKKEEHGGSAYKASGMERIFGKEKPAGEKTGDTTTTATSGASAAAGATADGIATSAPTQAAPSTGPNVASAPADEKTGH